MNIELSFRVIDGCRFPTAAECRAYEHGLIARSTWFVEFEDKLPPLIVINDKFVPEHEAMLVSYLRRLGCSRRPTHVTRVVNVAAVIELRVVDGELVRC